MIHNNCKFRIVEYFDNKAVIEVRSIDGGGFEDWVKDNF